MFIACYVLGHFIFFHFYLLLLIVKIVDIFNNNGNINKHNNVNKYNLSKYDNANKYANVDENVTYSMKIIIYRYKNV